MAVTACRDQAGFTLVELLVVTVIVLIMMGIAMTTTVETQRAFGAQRERMDTTQQAQAALDMIARLVRMSGNNPHGLAFVPLEVDHNGNGALDSIWVRADWNPADGALTGAYEDVLFSVVGNQLFKQEPADNQPVLFAENIASLTFAYRDTNNNVLANPAANIGRIAFVTITATTAASGRVQDGPPMVLTTSVAVRRTE